MKTFIDNAPAMLLLAFLAITFLQSGIDKVFDWKGNLGWLKEHFSKSPLKNLVPLLLGVITIIELVAGFLSVVGIFQLLVTGNTIWGLWGAILSSVALLMLLFGQRMAKDYEGAKTIAVYFIAAVSAVFLLSAHHS